ncbi:hypothetical protein BWR17_09725 [Phaeobacter inhibens]|uniref:ribbon-helix-helix domain-containing protein n=1 Tax=Phaeobacter inhibens TaxID=221822 RepID=UPI0009718060|nr:type II toxin-antitoxin system ParD family antitoxin [Phaeobacter inhibens]APX16086.1 hypothetical protein BWR17_09725 [Phaeobacter inhibens]
METIDIALPNPMKTWVEAQTEEGQFLDRSDFMQHLIRKEQTRQQALSVLQTAVTEGIESGTRGAFDMDSFKARLHTTHPDV